MRNFVFTSILVLIIPYSSSAWGVLGHRVVGEIADQYLTNKTRAEIKKILGNESIAMASNWGDFVKSDTAYDYLYPWHYVNLKTGMRNEQVQEILNADTGVNLYNRIMFLINELKSKQTSGSKRLVYLKLLIHFVGDAHQPMHAARREDRGGNDIKLFWFNNPTNLHRIWDEQLVEFQQLSYTEHARAINFTSLSERKKWQAEPVSQWIFESYQIAGTLYTGVVPGAKLGYNYNYLNVHTMNRQLLKGGVRLAGMLNSIFG